MNELIASGLLVPLAIAVGLLVGLALFRSCLFVLEPRQAAVLLYFGSYRRTAKRIGFNFAFPFGLQKQLVSTRDTIISLPITTVVEASGNPIQVSAVCVYRISDAKKASLDIADVHRFVTNQASASVKSVCSGYPYEPTRPGEVSLKGENPEFIEHLHTHLQSQLSSAGVEILRIRLNDLTYAPEIAQAMLLRQQAEAMVDARRTVVDGAVGTVRQAMKQLDENGIRLSAERRVDLISNLTLLLCAGDRGSSQSTVVSSPREHTHTN